VSVDRLLAHTYVIAGRDCIGNIVFAVFLRTVVLLLITSILLILIYSMTLPDFIYILSFVLPAGVCLGKTFSWRAERSR